MADRLSLLEEELSCPLCFDVFNDPLVLRCSHSFCRACLEEIWEKVALKECPVCRRLSSMEQAVSNLVLKNTCETFLEQKSHKPAAESESLCCAHGEKLRLFCLDDGLLLCVVCQASVQHKNHSCCLAEEAVTLCKEKVGALLMPLKDNLKLLHKHKRHCEETAQHIRSQQQLTERQIKKEFQALRQFLLDQESVRISELREEESEKSRIVRDKILSVTAEMSILADTVKSIEEDMAADNTVFLQNYESIINRTQRSVKDPEVLLGVLIDVAGHLGSLKYKVWEQMLGEVEKFPVTLDPNTANCHLTLSADLSSMKYEKSRKIPDSAERFGQCVCALGSEGFDSGTHRWDVEVGDNTYWILGVAGESIRRKEKFSTYPENGFWTIRLRHGQYRAPRTALAVVTRPQRVRVQLDWDQGELLFMDPSDCTPLYTFTHRFTEKVYPFISTGCRSQPLRILPVTVSLQS